MKTIKQCCLVLLLSTSAGNVSALECPITVTDGELAYFSAVVQEIALSTDGSSFDVVLLNEETELDTLNQLQGALNEVFQNTAVPVGTYTHLRLTMSGHGIKGWVTDGTDMWYTTTSSSGFTTANGLATLRVDSSSSAPTAGDYGKSTHSFDTNYTNTFLLIEPLVVSGGSSSSLIFAQNIETAVSDINAEFVDPGDGVCQVGFLGRGDDVYSMLITAEPSKAVKVHYAGINANAGKTHSLSMLFGSSDQLLGAYSHREGTVSSDQLVSASMDVTAVGTNTYDQVFDVTIWGEGLTNLYQFTGLYDCTGAVANQLYIYEDAVVVPDISTSGTVDCINL